MYLKAFRVSVVHVLPINEDDEINLNMVYLFVPKLVFY